MTDENAMNEETPLLEWRPDMARVLVIDDCGAFRSAIRFILERDGFDVLEARDALAGLQRAVEDAPDLVLVASELSGLGGLDIAARIASEPSTRGLPVFVTHDRPDDAIERLVRAAGGHGVVARSASASEWLSLIRDALWPLANARLALATGARLRF